MNGIFLLACEELYFKYRFKISQWFKSEGGNNSVQFNGKK